MIGSKLNPLEVYKGSDESPEWFKDFLSHYAELTQAFITLRDRPMTEYSSMCLKGIETRIFIGNKPRGAVLVSGRCVSHSIRIDNDSVYIKPIFKAYPSILKTWPTDSLSIAGDVREDFAVGDRIDVNGGQFRITGLTISRDSQIVTNIKIDGRVQVNVGDLIRLDADKLRVLVFF